MSPDQNRQRPRSSKKRRATATAAGGPAAGAPRPSTQRVPAGRTRPRQAARSSGGIPTSWLAAVAVVVIGVGLGFATGAIRLGGGAPGDGATASARIAGPAGGIAGCPSAQPEAASAGTSPVVTIQTPKGTIELTLQADRSPIAVGNFVALAQCGYYDNVVFHRVVPNFVIQAGDGQFGRTTAFDAGRVGIGGPGYDLTDEAVTTQYQRGTVAMARGRGPNSAGSQFFIVLSDEAQGSLAAANTYQILGSVTKGMEVADAIAAAADAEKPSQPVPMTDVSVRP
ncbi:MAG TPA: peptidylprolyl isomerase [Candidatus Limnocylindrales bacterium]|nr:peptidylprolyl isomerase [Candidatus Limnocylindrales bacterium]